MNVFWLDLDPMKSARYACDQHVVKMITEQSQILLTVLNELGFKDIPMKPFPMNKQLLQWAFADWANFAYLFELTREYYLEYVWRYGKFDHLGWSSTHEYTKSIGGLRAIRSAFKDHKRDTNDVLYSAMRSELHLYVTVPPLYIDDKYKKQLHGPRVSQLITVVSCYRAFYNGTKTFARYRYRQPPAWLQNTAR